MNIRTALCWALVLCSAQTLAQSVSDAPASDLPQVNDVAPAAAPLNGDTADTANSERKLLVMLRLPAPHFRPDAGYGGRYIDDGGRSARHRIAEELARLHGLKLVSDWPMPTLGVDCYVMEYAEHESPERLAALLAQDPRVEWAQPVALFRGMGSDDPLYPVQPSAKFWHVAELHQATTGRNVSVAVIDSGIDQQHPDLAGQVAIAENFVDNSAYAAELHGTAVAGIIAARAGHGGILGVAPGARLQALRACWQQADLATRCSSFTLGKALNFAILNHAKIINLSLSGPQDRLLNRLLDVALERGITVVGAVDPQDGSTFPAAHAGVIAVAPQAPAGLHPASLPAAAPDGVLFAPGHDIPTTAPGARWSFVSGSSYATAHVSGMLALLAQLQPDATPAQLRRQLLPGAGLNTGTIDACATITHASGACSCACAIDLSLKASAHP